MSRKVVITSSGQFFEIENCGFGAQPVHGSQACGYEDKRGDNAHVLNGCESARSSRMAPSSVSGTITMMKTQKLNWIFDFPGR